MNLIEKPVRLCYIIDNTSFRGGERTFSQLALGLDKTRYDVHVICSPGGRFVEILTAAKIPVFPSDMRNKWNFSILPSMARYLRQHRFDIVHTQGRGDPFGRIAARVAGVPLVISTTAMVVSRYSSAARWRKWLYRVIDRVTDPLVDHFIVVNQASVESLVTEHRIQQNHITVILNGVEVLQYLPDVVERVVWRTRWQVGEGELVVGAVGSLTWQKGFEYLLRTWILVRAKVPHARLFIFGEGELAPKLKSLVVTLGISDSCTFKGFEPDMKGVFAGLDLFVLPSLAEGLPMVLLEAMACGKPVVATNIAGNREVITPDTDGLLVKPGDIGDLANALIRLLQSPELALRLGTSARQTVLKRFSVDRMISETDILYQNLLAR